MSDPQQWYMSIGGHQVGPISAEEILSNIRSGRVQPGTYIYAPGMADWVPASKVELFTRYFSEGSPPANIPGAPGRTARETASVLFMQGGLFTPLICRRDKRCAWTQAASWRCSRA